MTACRRPVRFAPGSGCRSDSAEQPRLIAGDRNDPAIKALLLDSASSTTTWPLSSVCARLRRSHNFPCFPRLSALRQQIVTVCDAYHRGVGVAVMDTLGRGANLFGSRVPIGGRSDAGVLHLKVTGPRSIRLHARLRHHRHHAAEFHAQITCGPSPNDRLPEFANTDRLATAAVRS